MATNFSFSFHPLESSNSKWAYRDALENGFTRRLINAAAFYANLLEIFLVKSFDKDNKFPLSWFCLENELGHTCQRAQEGRTSWNLNCHPERICFVCNLNVQCASINYSYCRIIKRNQINCTIMSNSRFCYGRNVLNLNWNACKAEVIVRLRNIKRWPRL